MPPRAPSSNMFKSSAKLTSAANMFTIYAPTKRFGGFDFKKLITDVGPENYTKLIMSQPGLYRGAFKNMADADLIRIIDDLTLTGKAAFLKKADAATKLRLGLTDDAAAAAKKMDEFATTGGKTVKSGSKEFWTAIGNGTLVIGGLALLAWIDDKFEDAEEEYKNCMAGCLPHNWDAYDQEVITSSELLYSNATSLTEYQITPIPKQPYCTDPNVECEEYCDPKCDELSKVDIPFADSPLNPLNPDSPLNPFNPDSPLNPFKWLERLLPDGFDIKLISGASSASSLAVVALVVMSMVMKR